MILNKLTRVKMSYLAETAPEYVIAGTVDVDIIVEVHPVDGIRAELMEIMIN